jgi:phosphate/sulfate permease
MKTVRQILKIVGFTGIALCFLQILNLYVELIQISIYWLQFTLVVGITSLFLLVLIDRLTNEEDKHYSKNVEK